jgi:hypothetical protein
MLMRADHAERKIEIIVKQVQGTLRGPQVWSCEDANIVVIKASPSVSHQIIDFYFN